jgi:hypothetical protein
VRVDFVILLFLLLNLALFHILVAFVFKCPVLFLFVIVVVDRLLRLVTVTVVIDVLPLDMWLVVALT